MGDGELKILTVDVGSLTEFASGLVAEVQADLVPAADKLRGQVDVGPKFGVNPDGLGGEIPAKADEYYRCLIAGHALFRNLVEGTRQLAQAAAKIGSGYGEADQFSQVTVADVTAVLPPVTPSGPIILADPGSSTPPTGSPVF